MAEVEGEAALYEAWYAMAEDSYAAAQASAGFPRTALSRYYYAAYQAVTAALLYRGVTPPVVNGIPREAWSHEDTPEVFEEQIKAIDRNRDRRRNIAGRLRDLYRKRIDADYVSKREFADADFSTARRDAGFIVKYVGEVLLPEK